MGREEREGPGVLAREVRAAARHRHGQGATGTVGVMLCSFACKKRSRPSKYQSVVSLLMDANHVVIRVT